MLEIIEDLYDVLVHNHILGWAWRLPQSFHDWLLRQSGRRVVQFQTIDGQPYRWEVHKKWPPEFALGFSVSRVDPEFVPDEVKRLKALVEELRKRTQ